MRYFQTKLTPSDDFVLTLSRLSELDRTCQDLADKILWLFNEPDRRKADPLFSYLKTGVGLATMERFLFSPAEIRILRSIRLVVLRWLKSQASNDVYVSNLNEGRSFVVRCRYFD